MFAHLEPILQDLRPCFSRQVAFEWFVMIIMGFLIRCDHTGLTRIVRWLFLSPEGYELILHFFRATSWQLEPLLSKWAQVALKRLIFPLCAFSQDLCGFPHRSSCNLFTFNHS